MPPNLQGAFSYQPLVRRVNKCLIITFPFEFLGINPQYRMGSLTR